MNAIRHVVVVVHCTRWSSSLFEHTWSLDGTSLCPWLPCSLHLHQVRVDRNPTMCTIVQVEALKQQLATPRSNQIAAALAKQTEAEAQLANALESNTCLAVKLNAARLQVDQLQLASSLIADTIAKVPPAAGTTAGQRGHPLRDPLSASSNPNIAAHTYPSRQVIGGAVYSGLRESTTQALTATAVNPDAVVSTFNNLDFQSPDLGCAAPAQSPPTFAPVTPNLWPASEGLHVVPRSTADAGIRLNSNVVLPPVGTIARHSSNPPVHGTLCNTSLLAAGATVNLLDAPELTASPGSDAGAGQGQCTHSAASQDTLPEPSSVGNHSVVSRQGCAATAAVVRSDEAATSRVASRTAASQSPLAVHTRTGKRLVPQSRSTAAAVGHVELEELPAQDLEHLAGTSAIGVETPTQV